MQTPRKIALFPALALTIVLVAACTSGPSAAPAQPPAPTTPAVAAAQTSAPASAASAVPGQTVQLNGAGATFPFPLLSKWSSEYQKVRLEIQINYQSIGSGGGIRQFQAGTVDFGASDAPLTDDQFKSLPGVLHVPETIGAVVLVYNIPGVAKGLKVTPDVVADIFLGKITKWNDDRIKSLNPDVASILPDKELIVVHRSDGSGTTYVWVDYLSHVSDAWKATVGKGTSVNWPVGLGGKGNEGVAGIVGRTPYSVGYVEFVYATNNNIPYASIQNRAGKFVAPSLDSISAAVASAAPTLPKGDQSWSAVTMVDPPGADAYPVSSMTYILLSKEQKDAAKGKALVDYLWWAVHDGQKFSPDLQYVPLPAQVVSVDEASLRQVTSGGVPLLAP